MKIALITDQHFGIRGDSIHFLDYYEKFYSNVFFPELKTRKIDTVIDLGDSFDRRKYINYMTLKKSKEMWFDPLYKNKIKMHSIVGNHTVYYKNTNEVNSFDILMGEYPNIKNYSSPEQVEFGGVSHAIVPWINNANYADTMKFLETTDSQVVFGHFEIAGCKMDRTTVNEHGILPHSFKRFDRVFSGHFHHKSTTGNIDYLGAPYEMTWADYQDPKGFHIYDTVTREIEFIENPYRLFHKIFYNEGKDIDVGDVSGCYVKVIKQDYVDPNAFDEFMDSVMQQEPLQVQIVEDNLAVELDDDDIDEAEDTLTIMSKYVDLMPDAVPKKKVESLIRSLYTEALNMEK
jgi:hypothetical protein